METTQPTFKSTFNQQLLIDVVIHQLYSFFQICVKARWQIHIFTDNSKHHFQVFSWFKTQLERKATKMYAAMLSNHNIEAFYVHLKIKPKGLFSQVLLLHH